MGSHPINMENARQIRCMFDLKHLEYVKQSFYAWKTGTARENCVAKNATKSTAQTHRTIHPYKLALVSSIVILHVLTTTRVYTPNKKGLHVANINICRIKPKLDEIKLLLNSSSNLDILGLCETFLDEKTDDNILQIEGFNFERKDRATLRQDALNTKRGGGVVVYIADHIKYKRQNDLESSEIESIWLEINLKNTKPFLISSVYRPPSSHVQWINEFSL